MTVYSKKPPNAKSWIREIDFEYKGNSCVVNASCVQPRLPPPTTLEDNGQP